MLIIYCKEGTHSLQEQRREKSIILKKTVLAAVSVVVTLGLGSGNALTAEDMPTAQIAKVEEKKPVPLYFSYTGASEEKDLLVEETSEDTMPLPSGGRLETALRFAEILPFETMEFQSSDASMVALSSIDQTVFSESAELQPAYTEAEKKMIAKVVYAEARGESFEGKVAVAQVVINRYESGKFGKSLKRIVYGKHQFAVGKRFTDVCIEAVEYAIENMPHPENMFFFQVSKRKHWRNFVYYDRIGHHSFYCSKE